jgi:hypothetical protein
MFCEIGHDFNGTVKLCKDCKWSGKSNGVFELLCFHPNILSTSPWALGSVASDGGVMGVNCVEERCKSTVSFGLCSIKGRLWEKKDD